MKLLCIINCLAEKTSMKKSSLFIIAICFAVATQAQKLPCSNPVYRQFDFWIGEWEAFGPNGKKITNIPINESWTANLCFGGKDGKELFITASKGIYILQMLVSGMK